MRTYPSLAVLASTVLLFNFTPTTVNANSLLCRGVGLWLPFNSPEQGPGHQYSFPELRSQRHAMSDGEMQNLRATGFDFVRLSVNPGPFLAASPDQRKELDERLQSFIQRLLGKGLNVDLDLQAIPTNPSYAPKLFVSDPGSPLTLAYRKLIEDMAAMARAKPPGRIVFEVTNEPPVGYGAAGVGAWQSMMEDFYDSAHKRAPQLPLIVTGGRGGTIDGLMLLNPQHFARDDTYYSFHYYLPMQFTHQNVSFRVQYHNLVHLPFPPPVDLSPLMAAARERVMNDATIPEEAKENAIQQARIQLTQYGSFSPDIIGSDFARVAQWADDNGIRRDHIFLGEFGTVSDQPGLPGATHEDRARWLRAVRLEAEKNGFVWDVWNYRDTGNFSIVANNEENELDPLAVSALGLHEPSRCGN